MTTKESVEQLNSLIEHFNNGGNDFNATDIEAIQCLLKENQELNKKYLNAVADYETTMFEKEQLNSLVNSCQEEIRRLKKQLEENKHKGLYNTCLPYSTGYNKAIKDKETQQKEFIEYMNKTIEELECDDVDDEEMKGYLIQRIDIYKEILQKYKEIIGVSDDKTN